MRLHMLIPVALVCLLASCGGNDIQQVRKVSRDTEFPVETGRNVTINYTDSGFLKARVFTPLMERYASDDKQYTEMTKGITIYFLTKDKKVESYLKSKYAIRYDRDKKMIARNDVVLVNIKGDTMRTEELLWNEATQRISSEKSVRITTKDEIIIGDGFESNAEFTQYKIFRIRGTVNLKN